MRERPCSEGDAGLCDGSERDMEVCNDQPLRHGFKFSSQTWQKMTKLLYSFEKFSELARLCSI